MITSLLDHAAVDLPDRGKLLTVDLNTGAISFTYGLRVAESMGGIIDGSNRNFTTSIPFVSGTISVFINGLKETHFIELSDKEIILDTAPKNTGFTDTIETMFTKK